MITPLVCSSSAEVRHDTGRLVWAAPGGDRKTVQAFLTALGESRCAAITHVSADAAQ